MDDNNQNMTNEEEKVEQAVTSEAHETIAEPNNTPSGNTQNNNIDENKGMAALSYLGLLALIPFLTVKDNQWVKQHAVQGMNLFIIEVIGCIASVVPFIGWIAGFVIFAFSAVVSIMGLINVFNGEYKDLPLISNFKFIK